MEKLNSTKELILKIENTFNTEHKSFKMNLRYLHPKTIVTFSHESFKTSLDEEELKGLFFQKLNDVSISASRHIEELDKLTWMQIDYAPISKFNTLENEKDTSTSWSFANLQNSSVQPLQNIVCAHFYGYKGGQGRTSILAQIAKSAALEGWKVLIIDADFEAPSCHSIFKRELSVENTIFALFENLELKPLRVLAPELSPLDGPGVYILGAKPSNLDTSTYLARVSPLSTSPIVIENFSQKILTYATENRFQAILIDHRTGLSNITIPLLHTFPGQGIVLCRLDKLWQDVKDILKIFIKDVPSFKLVCVDPFQTPQDNFELIYGNEIEGLKEMVFDALKEKYPEEANEIDIEIDVSPNVFNWRLDSSYQQNLLPEQNALHTENYNTLEKLRNSIGLGGKQQFERSVPPNERGTANDVKHSSSGATTDGKFLFLNSLKQAWNRREESLFFLGRKGSGKTSSILFFTRQGIGTPLVGDQSWTENGENVGLNFASFKDFKEMLTKNSSDSEFQNFWRVCFLIGARSEDGLSRNLEKQFNKLTDKKITNRYFVDQMAQLKPRIYLLDSFETFCNQDVLEKMLNALFDTLRDIESFCKQHKFWIFLRKDLLFLCGQNQEQLRSGRTIELDWKLDEILNLLVYRLAEAKVLNTNKEAMNNINNYLLKSNENNFFEMQFSSEECFDILCAITFPKFVESRGHPTFSVYFEGHFADSQDDKNPRFNPRFIHFFVSALKNESNKSKTNGNIKFLSEDIMNGHKAATQSFFHELSEEVNNLASQRGVKKEIAKNILEGFQGLHVPFREEELKSALIKKSFNRSDIGKIYEILKQLGIVYIHELNPELTRMTKLVRISLNMKINTKLNSKQR